MVKKVKKKRIRIIPCLIFILVLGFFYIIGNCFFSIPVKNIFIYGNELLNDQEIIDLANLSDYPKYYSFSKRQIKNKIKENEYVKEVKVKRTFFHKLEIYVEEYKILMHEDLTNNYILSNGEKITLNKYHNQGYPTLVNYISDDVYDKFISQLNDLDLNIINQISEIKYEPSQYDNGRFFLTMNDGNYIYINISNFKSLNLYNDIYPSFEGHIGILYLDSGYGDASEYKILK